MAQTNYTPISLYYSTTASAVPTAANLVQGELAINTADGKLYYEDSSGVVQVLATKSTGSIGGSNTQVQFNNSGSLGGSSSFTWDGTTVTATKFAGALNGTVGATTASTGAFTTLTSNGATTFTAGTASTSTTTGTTVITGGLGVSGRINAANFDGIVGANTAAAGSFTTINASTSITNAGLTSGRVTYAGASGLLTDSANFTFSGTQLTVSSAITSNNNGLVSKGNDASLTFYDRSDAAKYWLWYASGGYANLYTATGITALSVNYTNGNVGIGTSSPAQPVELVKNQNGSTWFSVINTDANTGAAAGYLMANNTGTLGALQLNSSTNTTSGAGDAVVLRTLSTNPLIFGTNSTERMRIDSSGNVGIGSTSPGGSSTSRQLTLQGTTAQITLTTGSVNYNSGINASNVAYLEVSGANPLVFYTNSSERMRIDSSGNLLVGATSLIGTERLSVVATGNNPSAIFKNAAGSADYTSVNWNNATTGDNKFVGFYTETSPTLRGDITYNRVAGLVAYNTTSDYRAKDIISPVLDSGEVIDSVPVYMGKMKGATQARPMFIAHETPSYAHTGEKDAVDKDGKPVYQQMDASSLIPVMWAEIQSLRQRIATLENK